MRSLLSLCIVFTLLATTGYVRAQDVVDVETVVFRVDFLSLQPKTHYGVTHSYEETPPPPGYQTVVNLHYDYEEPTDFGYLEVLSALTGQRVLRATTWWAGIGRFEIPSDSLGSTDFGESGPPVVADTVAVALLAYGEEAEARAAWDAVARTEPARNLAADGPVEVVVFEHFYTVGAEDPTTAEWLVVAYTRPRSSTAISTDLVREQGLLTVYPNPVASSATAVFHLQQEGHVTLRLFDVLGHEVTTLSDARQPAGRTEVMLPLAAFPSGVYFVRFEAGEETETRPITVLR